MLFVFHPDNPDVYKICLLLLALCAAKTSLAVSFPLDTHTCLSGSAHAANDASLRIMAVGDIVLGAAGTASSDFAFVQPYFEKSDLLIGNL